MSSVATDFSYATAAAVFFTYVVIDVLYARYVIEVGRANAVRAATISSVLYSLLAYGILQYSHNIWYLIPLVLGAWIGTYLTVRLHPR
jgi:uncharacterized membrane protein YfcA